jgi:hypothetical protein
MAILAAALALGQQASPKKRNQLLVGKLIYVSPIPSDIDRWIGDYLNQWGKYKLTGNPEGVDLIVNAVSSEKEAKLVNRRGVPQPQGEGRHFPGRGRGNAIPVTSISVSDWATNEVLWQADILDRKQKKDEANPPAGPHTTIFARDLTSDQLAQKVTEKLRDYVSELEKAGAVKP